MYSHTILFFADGNSHGSKLYGTFKFQMLIFLCVQRGYLLLVGKLVCNVYSDQNSQEKQK